MLPEKPVAPGDAPYQDGNRNHITGCSATDGRNREYANVLNERQVAQDLWWRGPLAADSHVNIVVGLQTAVVC